MIGTLIQMQRQGLLGNGRLKQKNFMQGSTKRLAAEPLVRQQKIEVWGGMGTGAGFWNKCTAIP